MNYIGRKDGGSYISSEKDVSNLSKYQAILLSPIGYNDELAKMASEKGIPYRIAYIAAIMEDNGFSGADYIKSAQKPKN